MPVLAPERPGLDEAPLPPLFRPRGPRRLRGRGLLRSAATVVVAMLALVGVARLGDLLPGFGNPFTTERVDRTGPAVLKALEDLREFRGASGHFQVIVDIEKDTRYVPSVLKGERTLFVAIGTVDASVDFAAPSVAVSEDRRSVTVTLPRARLGGAVVDTGRSYVADRDRGLLDRVGSVFSDNPTSEKELYRLASLRLADAAGADSALVDAAERNTRAMLEGLLRGLGFTTVTVAFG